MRQREVHVEMEVESSVMQPQATAAQETPKAGRGRKDASLEPLEGVQPCPHLDFGLLASRTVRE